MMARSQDTAQHIMKHFEEVSRLGQQNLIPQQVFEKKMTWLVYMMGALVGGHASAKANRTDTDCAPTHVVNGELAGRIFRLVNLTVQQKQTCEGLEIACACMDFAWILQGVRRYSRRFQGFLIVFEGFERFSKGLYVQVPLLPGAIPEALHRRACEAGGAAAGERAAGHGTGLGG